MTKLPFKEYPRGGMANGIIDNLGQAKLAAMVAIDTSLSMPEDELNEAYACFLSDLKSNLDVCGKVEIGVVTFDDSAHIMQPFGSVYDMEPLKFSCGGTTSLHAACDLSLEELRIRNKQYEKLRTPYYRNWLIILTDGQPNDPENGAIKRLVEAQEKEVIVYPIAIGEHADIKYLKSITTTGKVLKAGRDNLTDIFEWISRSFRAVSESSPGDVVVLPKPEDYQLTVIC